MSSLKTKLLLSALGVALLATPALAQRSHHQPVQPVVTDAGRGFSSYPNPQTHSGSEMSRESGNDNIGGIE